MLYATKAEVKKRFGTGWAWVWMKMLDETTQVSLPNLRAVSAVAAVIQWGMSSDCCGVGGMSAGERQRCTLWDAVTGQPVKASAHLRFIYTRSSWWWCC